MARRFTHTDGIRPTDLLHCGLDHLGAAQTLFDTGPHFYDSAGYLAHLGIEMLIKGWTLEVCGSFLGVHDLEDLYAELERQGQAAPLDANLAPILEKLSGYEELRYPNLLAPTEVGSNDWPDVARLAGHICQSMPKALEKQLAKINSGDSGTPITKAGRMLMKKPVE